MLAARQVLGLGAVRRARPGGRGRGAAAAATRRARPPGRAARSWPCQSSSVGSRRRARRNSRSAPRSSSAERQDLRRVAVRPRSRCDAGRRPGGSRGSRRGSSARPGRGWRRSSRCARRAGRTAARPAGARPGWRRSARWWSGRCRRSARASGAARPTTRWARTARARARSRTRHARAAPRACATRRAAATPPPARRNGRLWPTASSPAHARLGEDGVGVRAQRLDLGAPVADELARVGGRDHHDPVAAPAELVREPLDEAVDLVVLLPGIGRDLGDREPLARHARSYDADTRLRGAGGRTSGSSRPPATALAVAVRRLGPWPCLPGSFGAPPCSSMNASVMSRATGSR